MSSIDLGSKATTSSLSNMNDFKVNQIYNGAELDCEGLSVDLVSERKEFFREVDCGKVDSEKDPSLLYRSIDTL